MNSNVLMTPLSSSSAPAFRIGIDPGQCKLGFCFLEVKSMQANFMRVNLYNYNNGVKPKKIKEYERLVCCFLCDYQAYFVKCERIVIEFQAISTPTVKAIAKFLLERCQYYFPRIQSRFLSPVIYRAYLGITVWTAEFPGTTKLQKYNIRKELSLVSGVLDREDEPKYAQLFNSREKGHIKIDADPMDAANMILVFTIYEDEILEKERKMQSTPDFSKLSFRPQIQNTPTLRGVILNFPSEETFARVEKEKDKIKERLKIKRVSSVEFNKKQKVVCTTSTDSDYSEEESSASEEEDESDSEEESSSSEESEEY
jgi:hypothetical protein